MSELPTPTYDLISEQTLGSAAATVTFSSIPGTYKDLVIEFIGDSTASTTIGVQFNNDTGSNYSYTNVLFTTTGSSSGRGSNETYASSSTTWNGSLSTAIYHIMSYANTNVNKTMISRDNNAANRVGAWVNLWRSTSAITSVALTTKTNGTFNTNSVFRLWGVA